MLSVTELNMVKYCSTEGQRYTWITQILSPKSHVMETCSVTATFDKL